MNQSTKRILLSSIAAILLLTACASAPAPTQDPAQVQQQIAQSVALTVAAQSAQTAAAKPSDTPLPTPTEVVSPTQAPLLPTATPFVIVPPPTIAAGGGGSGGGVTVKSDYSCDIIHARPFDNTYFRPNDTFDIKWTILNTGTKTMRAGLDLKYLSGDEMTTVKKVELPEIKPGEQYSVNFDAVVPAKEGFHVMTWVVEGPLCYPYVAIYVEK